MSRTISNTVDYFPHFAKQGKTIFILKSRYGNDGYAFWFQLLELLSQAENHYYDCRLEPSLQYLLAFCGSKAITGTEILGLLAELGNIDPELWQEKVVWCPALVDNLADVYKKRGRGIPPKPIISNDNAIPDTSKAITGTEMPQTKVKESKVNKTKEYVPKQKFGQFLNVFLTTSEHEKLTDRFGTQGANDWIEELSLAKASKGYKTISDYATVLNWQRRRERDGGQNAAYRPNNQRVGDAGGDNGESDKFARQQFANLAK